MKLFFLITLIAISKLSYAAFDEESVRKCMNINDDTARLLCYDGLTNSLKKKNENSSNLAKGKWITNSETNPLDDSKTVTTYLLSDSGTSTYGEKIALILRCQSNKTNVFISWDDYLGDDPYVTSRIGKGEVDSKYWNISTNNTSTFYPSNQIEFIKSLFGNTTFVAQVTPYNDSPVTAVFDITGTEGSVNDLRAACNW